MTEKHFEVENIGPHEELTDRLHKLVTDGYKDGLPVFKEAIQNADDANATIVKVCLDKNVEKNLFNSKMPSKQGNALYIYNDSLFTEKDFANIAKLGAGTKSDSTEKIGQFGLGFCSNYNITDYPSIISGNTFVMFDPNITVLKDMIRDRSKPGIRLKFDAENFEQFSEIYESYEGIFGCHVTKNYWYQGTLIRLPFRKVPSLISKTIYKNDSDIADLFKIVIENSDHLLLFTQSVKEFELYTLENNSTEMEQIYKLKVSLDRCIQSHDIDISSNNLINESSILKASKNLINRQSQNEKIENVMIVKTESSIKKSSLIFKSSPPGNDLETREKFWLSVSSFSTNHLRNDNEAFKNFVPCVGMALGLEREENDRYSLLPVEDFNGTIFCFLPLSIENSFKYHLNCAFALTEDRLRIFEKSKDDRGVFYKHDWNEYLIPPILENLFTMINYVQHNVGIKDTGCIFDAFFPIENSSYFFKKYQTEFYESVCTNESTLLIFPSKVENAVEFFAYKDCVFLDFEFDEPLLQKIGIDFVNKLQHYQDDKSIIDVPKKYLDIIKSHENDDNKFLGHFEFLETLINNKNLISIDDYIHLISFFLKTKCIEQNTNTITRFGELIRSTPSIVSSNQKFFSPHNLVNKKSNDLFSILFDSDSFEDAFLHENYYENDFVILVLEKLGTIAKTLTPDWINKIAQSIKDVFFKSPEKAELISSSLFKYFSQHSQSDMVLSNLSTIEWVFCKKCPQNWPLEWAGKINLALYKPSEIQNDVNECLVACLQPVLEQKKCILLKTKDKPKNELAQDSIKQIIYLQKLSISNENLNAQQHDKIQQLFINFFTFMKANPDSITVENLPSDWIYCREKKAFLNSKNLGMKVHHAHYPYMYQLPHIYQDDPINKAFFKQSGGVPEYFSLESLKEILNDLKEKFGDNRLDGQATKLCLNVLKEIVHLSENKLDLSFQLKDLKKDSDFYLLDNNGIMREAKFFYSTQTGLDENLEFFLLHDKINPKLFGIEDSRKMISQSIGKPFGQKEKLSNRIKRILDGYSKENDIFKEQIQNSDDAGATEVKFIIDNRSLNVENIFGESYASLQGPALCCWNNAIFSDEDYEGIINLGEGSKQEDLSKTGRFGVGMNAVYHISDVIQFISDYDQFIILDPLCKYYPDADYTNPGRRIDAKKYLNPKSMYSDIYAGFEFMPLKKSTMFRFPLRTMKMIDKKEFLSENTFSVDKITRMMLDFSENNECLIFLKNVKKISFYEIDQNNNLQCLKEKKISFQEGDESKWDTFQTNLISQMKKNLRFTQLQSQMIACNVNIESSSQHTEKSLKKYHVRHQFGFGNHLNNDQLKEINDLYDQKTAKFFPIAGIAINLDLLNSECYKLYSFLPLNQDSPVACHINGYWALKNENRSELFENSTVINIMDAGRAKWCQQWNKTLIDYIILPLYVDSMKDRKLPMPDEKINKKTKVLKAYWKAFPQGIHSLNLKDYFSTMFKSFYENVFDKDIIPIYSEFEQVFKFYSPSKLLFSTNEMFESNSTKIDKTEIEAVIQNIVETFCMHTELMSLFKSVGKIELKVLDGQSLINGLKEKSYQFEDLKIEDSIFKSIKNVMFLLQLCVDKDNESDILKLNNVPLMVNNNNRVKMFTTNANRPFYVDPSYYDEVMKYQPSINLIHRDMYSFSSLVNVKSPFLRSININDLSLMLPSILGQEYEINAQGKYPESTNEIKEKLKLIWNIIFDCMRNELSEKSSRLDKLNMLNPIRNWTLIPVKCEKKFQLAPLIDIENIISKKGTDYMLKLDFLNELIVMNDFYFTNIDFRSRFNELTDSIAMNLKNASDFITVIFNRSKKIESFKSVDAEDICGYLNQLLKTKWKNKGKRIIPYFDLSDNLKTELELKNMLHQIKIFKECNTGNLICLCNKKNVAIGYDVSISRDENYFKDYCKSTNEILIEYKYSIKNLYTYLNIECLSLNDFHKKFLTHYNARNDKTRLHQHMEALKNCVNTYEEEFFYTYEEEFLNYLREIKFIGMNSNFYKASDLYCRKNDLFSAAFSNSLLPTEYYSNNWISFLLRLGLNIKPNLKQKVSISNTFASYYSSRKVDITYMDKYSRMLIQNLKDSEYQDFLDQSKSVLFIPSYFTSKNDSVYYQMFEKTSLPKIICMNNSYLEDSIDFIWLTHSILPSYCKPLHDRNKLIPTCAQVVNNFQKMVSLCSENFLQSLSSSNRNELEQIFYKNYEYFNNTVKDKENHKTLEKLKDCKSVCYLQDGKLSLNKSNSFFRNLAKDDAIPSEILPTQSYFDDYPQLFEFLKLNENVCLSNCLTALCTIKNEQFGKNKMSDQSFNGIMILYKFFIYDRLLNESKSSEIQLYAPNMKHQLCMLNNLYYIDDLQCYASLIENYNEIQDKLIFDLGNILNSSSIKRKKLVNDENLSTKIYLKELNTWDKIFKNVPFFKRNKNLAPKPLSELIKRELNGSIKETIQTERNSVIHSDAFLNIVMQYLQNSDREIINTFLKSIVITTADKIETFYTENGRKLPIEQENHDFLIERINNKIKFILKEEWTKSKQNDFLREMVLSELKKAVEISSTLLKLNKFKKWELKLKIFECLENADNDIPLF